MPASQEKRKKELSQFLQNPVSLALAQTLPISVFRTYIHLLGFLYYLARSRERKETTFSITTRIANGAGPLQRFSLVFNTYRGIFEHYLEKLVIATRSPAEMAEYLMKNCELGDTKWLDLAEVAGRGGIVATGHFGASEYIPVLLAVHGYRVAAVTVYKNDRLREIARKRAEYYDIWLIDAGQTKQSFLEFMRAIGDGRILVVAFDEIDHWVPSPTCSVNFLGEVVPADRGLAVLQRRTKAPTCLGLLCRSNNKNRKRYRLALHPVSADTEGRLVSAATWEIFEEYIRRYPEQWYKWNEVARGLANYRLRAL
ncbi:MAG: hypothetical protein DRH12_04775 [Deltaproteobacteria bacterium]|nr:MAG: hypothetical protein DRH12_04775 [Deltaproteobacteria bacterium]